MHLLDTHVLAWTINEPERLSRTARRIIEDESFVVSSASLWEILFKKNKPDRVVPGDPVRWWQQYVVKNGMRVVPMEWQHIVHLDTLPGP